jgi:hypothetical protein
MIADNQACGISVADTIRTAHNLISTVVGTRQVDRNPLLSLISRDD